ncbi:MAG: hypothetical protein HWD92_05255 [Flavobacteriia bacterium]|nr:hypothetical protein [Flavobacteriia bacterium]
MWKISFLLLSFPLLAQQIDLSWLDETQFTAEQLETLQEELLFYSINPMSIQSSDPLYLERHPLINLIEAINIAKYVEEAGYFFDWGEVNNVYGIDQAWIEHRKRFLSLSRIESDWKLQLEKWQQVRLSLGVKLDDPRKEGYSSQSYSGPPFQDQGLFSLKGRNYSLGLRWQRDAGENWKSFERLSYDHLSVAFTWNPHRNFKVGLADYRLGRFLGTHVGSSFGSSIPADIAALQSRASQTRSTASAMEHGLWRGVNISGRFQNWTFSLQTGSASIDATIDNGHVARFIQTGLHRTESERTKQNSALGYHLGWEASSSFANLTLAAAQDYYWVKPIAEGAYSFEAGNSIYVQYLNGEDYLEFEWASRLDLSSAVQFFWTRHLGDLQMGIRGYAGQSDFHSGQFDAGGWFFTSGEERSLATVIAYNRGNHNWSSTLFSAQQRGLDWKNQTKSGFQVSYTNSRFTPTFRARYRWTAGTDAGVHYLQTHWTTSVGVGTMGFRLIQHFSSLPQGSLGVALDHKLSEGQLQWTTRLRAQWVGSDGHPVYFMQPTTRLQMQIQSMYKSGMGADALFSWNHSDKLNLQLQASLDKQLGVETRGSGMEQIESSIKWSLSAEMHWKW